MKMEQTADRSSAIVEDREEGRNAYRVLAVLVSYGSPLIGTIDIPFSMNYHAFQFSRWVRWWVRLNHLGIVDHVRDRERLALRLSQI